MNIKNRFAELRDEVVDLLNRAAAAMENVVPHLGDEGASSLSKTFQERANTVQNEEFVVVVVGEMNRGKSVLLNAMMHKQLLTMDTLECTATVNFLRYPNPAKDQSPDRVEVHFTNGKPLEKVPVGKLADYTSRLSTLDSVEVADLVDHVDVFVESRFLKDNVLLVDTPGTNTTTHNHIRITNEQIERSNAAIFLFDAKAQVLRSDKEFLEDVKEAVSRLFFVVNKIDDVEKIDKNEVDRVLESVESTIRGVVEQSEVRVFGLSGVKALLGRTGYVVKNPILEENERHKLDDPQFCNTLIEESRINAFEDDLERYLFGDGKGYDLLHGPISFIQIETAKLIRKLHRQIEVLDDAFDLSDLEMKIEKMDRTVGDRKRELEGMTDKLSEELSRALVHAKEAFEVRCGLAEETLKDYLNAYDSPEALEDNWNDGDHLADLPGRNFAELQSRAEKLLQDAVRSVLRKQTREIRRQVQGELGEIALELPEMPEMVLQLQAPKIDEAEEAKLKEREREIEEINRKLDQLEDQQAGGRNERRYVELREERQRLSEEHHSELQHLGSRPEAKIRTDIEEEVQDVRGIGGGLAYLFRGKKRIQIEKKIVDNQDQEYYDRRLRNIETQYTEKLAELDRQTKEAEKKFDAELVARRKAEKLEELNQNKQQALEKAESHYQEQSDKAGQRAATLNKVQLISTFQRAVEALKAAVEHSVGQTENMATDFIENAMAELDATLKAHNQELEKLKSLKEVKESERDTAKEGIARAIEDLKTLQEAAAHLEKEHEAFATESGEENKNE